MNKYIRINRSSLPCIRIKFYGALFLLFFIIGILILKPTPNEDKKPTRTEDKNSTRTEDEKPTRTEDRKPALSKDEKPIQTEDDKSALSKDKKPTRTEDEKPTQTEDKKPALSKDKKPTRTEDEKPIRTEDKKPARTEDEKPPQPEDEKPPQTDDEKPPQTEDKKPPQTEGEKPTRTEDEKPTRTEDKKPTRTEDKKPARTEDEKPARAEDRKPTQAPIITNPRPEPELRPYYFRGGKLRPQPAKISKETGRRDAKLLPSEDPDSDRFENQLMFVPPNYEEIRKSNKTKLIAFPNGVEGWWGIDFRWKDTYFTSKNCPVTTCTLSDKKEDIEIADLCMFSGQHQRRNLTRTPNQIYAFYRLESPVHWNTKFDKSIVYNWTITYRHDSTIPVPYYKWAYYNPAVKEIPQTINYAANKTKKVAWFVSNCEINNDRLSYAHQLQKHIEVDIYGKCGNLNCSDKEMARCLDMMWKEYKFYLAFENSNCVDYITEKLYRNGLQRNVLPIVMGARRQDYERQAPRGSYIFVEDFDSPKALAEYLHKLDKDDDLYNSYFKWKGTGEMLDKFHHLWCRICAMLHDEYSTLPHWYDDINEWWFGMETWRRGFWRDTTD